MKTTKKISNKVSKITKKPVSKTNPRRKVSQKQAVAVALSMSKKGKK